MVGAAGIVAERELLPDIQEKLGVAGTAEHGVHQHCGGHILAVGTETDPQFSLAHVHSLLHHPALLRRRPADRHRRLHSPLPGQSRKSPGKGACHPLLFGCTAVKQFQPGGGQNSLIMAVEPLEGDPLHFPGSPQAAETIGFLRAHDLQQPPGGIEALIIDVTADQIHQVGPLAVHIVTAKAAIACSGT